MCRCSNEDKLLKNRSKSQEPEPSKKDMEGREKGLEKGRERT